jgi:DNA-binding NtrC family response regulator
VSELEQLVRKREDYVALCWMRPDESLAATGGNVTAAARLAGISRTQFYEHREKSKLAESLDENS